MLVCGSHFFSKEDLKSFFIPELNYGIFDIPSERFKDLFTSVSFVPCEVDNQKTFKVCAVRKQGKMFTYDKDIVPISVYIFPYISNKKQDGYYIRFIAHTIDDSSLGFFLHVYSIEQYESFVKNAIVPYLEKITEMPSNEEFVEAFEEFNVSFDFN